MSAISHVETTSFDLTAIAAQYPAIPADELNGFAGFLDMMGKAPVPYNPAYEPATPITVTMVKDVQEEDGAEDQADPLLAYYGKEVSISYVIDADTIVALPFPFLGEEARDAAQAKANARPFKPMLIRCMETMEDIYTCYPMKDNISKGNRISGTPSVNRPVAAGQSTEAKEQARLARERAAEEKRRLAAERKAEADRAKAAARQAKLDRQQAEKEAQEKADALAAIEKASKRHPEKDDDAYNNFLLLREVNGATCMEMNAARNERRGLTDSNFGWLQNSTDMANRYGWRLIGKFRLCAICVQRGYSVAKSQKQAMRLIERNEAIPEGWYTLT